MKIGEYKKAEKYYTILENDLNLPEQHVDRARIYNRLGIIRHEQNELKLAIDYFKKAINAAPLDSNIAELANANMQVVDQESRRTPVIVLGKRLASSDVTNKPLVTNEISTPILENNLGYVAYQESNYEKAIEHYQKAMSIMIPFELSYLHEISCVYNNIGSVEYDKECSNAKDYFQKAILTLQRLSLNHSRIMEYKDNLASAQKAVVKDRRSNNSYHLVNEYAYNSFST